MRIRTEAPGDVHTMPRTWWPDSADAVGQKIPKVAVQAMLEFRVLLVGYPFQRRDGPMAAPGTTRGSKYKGGLHHLRWSRMSRLAPREVADRGHETPAQRAVTPPPHFDHVWRLPYVARSCAYISSFYLSAIINRAFQSNPSQGAEPQTYPQTSLASNRIVV
jgi:hypothetical protein